MNDSILKEHLGEDVLRVLHDTFNNYWDISTNKKTISTVMAQTEQKARKLEQKLPSRRYIIA